MITVKCCTVCRQEKPILEFHKCSLKKDGHYQQCKLCRNSKHDKYYRVHGERRKSTNRRTHLLRTYGITNTQYDIMLQMQQGRCGICKKHETELSRKLDIDHDHKTNKVRNLLCRNCNMGIGMFEDNPLLLVAAVKYLASHKNMGDTDQYLRLIGAVTA